MVARKIIDKDFRILSKARNSFTLPQVPDHHVETVYLENGSQSLQKSAHNPIDALEIDLFLHRTSNQPVLFLSLMLSKQI